MVNRAAGKMAGHALAFDAATAVVRTVFLLVRFVRVLGAAVALRR